MHQPAPTRREASLKAAAAPPRPIFRIVVALRNLLLRLADRLVPAQVPVLERLAGYYQLCAVHAAAELKVADRLAAGPKRVDELASAVGAKPELLERLLRALASYGMFARLPDGRWAQNRLSRVLLDGAPGSLRELAMFVGSSYHLRAWDRFAENLSSGDHAFAAEHGGGLFEYLASHADDAAHFDGAMVALTTMDAPALAAAYDFGALGDGKLCDVAGGRGTLLAAILQRHRRLRGVLFDDAKVVAAAGPLLRAHGVADRIEVVGGSFFEKVPPDCAAYLLKDILHDWDD